MSVDMLNIENLPLNHIMDKVEVYLNVFHSGMLNWIEVEVCSSQVVTQQSWWRGNWETEFFEQGQQPNCFRRSSR